MSLSADASVAVIAAVRNLPDGLRWVGIDGYGAAGKTSLAARIAAGVSRAVVVHLDDFQGEGITEWDWARFDAEVVAPLTAGREARYAIRAWGESASSGEGVVPPDAIVVVEGVSATRQEARVPWDLTVWVEAPEPVRRARALARDGAATEAIWRDHWLVTERAYGERERPWQRVDLVLSSGTMGVS